MTTLDKTLDITVETSTRDTCTVSMPTAHAFQPYGVVHGGINAVLVEHAGSILALANAPDGKVAVGSEISVSHLAPNTTELVRATASVIKIARSSITVSVTVTDAYGDSTAVGRLTCVFISV